MRIVPALLDDPVLARRMAHEACRRFQQLWCHESLQDTHIAMLEQTAFGD